MSTIIDIVGVGFVIACIIAGLTIIGSALLSPRCPICGRFVRKPGEFCDRCQ